MSVAANQKRPMKRATRRGLYGLAFVSPFLIGFIFIFIQLVTGAIQFSLSDSEMGAGGLVHTYVGFKHFRYAFFTDPDFVSQLIRAVVDTLTEIPVLLIFSLFVATLLNQKMPGRAFFRAVFFLPVVLMTGVVAKADYDINVMLSRTIVAVAENEQVFRQGNVFDSLNVLAYLDNAGFGTEIVDFIAGLISGIFQIVSRSGVQILVFLASLQSISPAIYESAQIEGASGWETYWKITIPMLSPYILANGVYTLIASFTNPYNPVMNRISEVGNDASRFGLASAMTWTYVTIIIVVLGILCAMFYRFVFYQGRE